MTIPTYEVPKIGHSRPITPYERPYTPDILKGVILADADHYIQHPEELPKPSKMQGIRGAVVKTMTQFEPEDTIRKLALAFLFIGPASAPISTSIIQNPGIMALHLWIGAAKIENDWIPQRHFADEYRFLCQYAAGLFVEEHGEPVEPKEEGKFKEYALLTGCTCGGNMIVIFDDKGNPDKAMCDVCMKCTTLAPEPLSFYIDNKFFKVV
jgi:hypothetical protein